MNMIFYPVIIWLMVALPKTTNAVSHYSGSTGRLYSSRYPNPYPNNYDYEYLIRRPLGNKITLTFSTFEVEIDGSTCIYDYLDVRDGCSATSPLIGRFCGDSVPSPQTTRSNYMYLLFHTDGSVQKKGFSATYTIGYTSGCPLLDCNTLRVPVHGYLSSTSKYNGKSVSVSCSRDYTLSGESTLICLSRSWSGTVGTCNADCSRLSAPTHGALSSGSVVHGTVVTASCFSYYTLVGERTLQCISGSWSGVVGTCEADCTQINIPAHGSLSSNNVTHGTVVTISCDVNYTLVGEKTLYCFSGSWTGTNGSCEADCTGLNAPTNGFLSSISVDHGTYVTVSCDAYYTLVGDRTLQCISGLLTGTIGTCEAVPIGRVVLLDGEDQLDTFAVINATEGSPKTLECKVDQSVLVTFMLWYIGDQLRQNGTNSTITFSPEMEGHDKHVFCKAYNLPFFDQAVQSVSPRLYVFGRPASPTTFLFTGLSRENASFYWISGYNGGYSQWFILQYRGLDEHDWINSSKTEELTSNIGESTLAENRAQLRIITQGNYQARIVAGNIKGEATPVYLKTATFQMLSIDSCQQSSSFSSVIGKESTTIIVGAASGAIILTLIGVIIFQRLCLNRKPKTDRSTVFISLDEMQRTQTHSENNYADLCASAEKSKDDNEQAECSGGDTTISKQVHMQELETDGTYEYFRSSAEISQEDYETVGNLESDTTSSNYVHTEELETQTVYENLHFR